MLAPGADPNSVLLPVIDLKRGQVVHAIAGHRETYRPLESQLIRSFHPGRVANALKSHTNCTDIYVADLDAIHGDEPDWNSYASIQNNGLSLWIDAGTIGIQAIEKMMKRVPGVHRVIVGLESLETVRNLELLCEALPADRLVFSLDLKEGIPVSKDPAAVRMSAESLAAYAVSAGVRSIIVLDLARVGASDGGVATVDICRNIRARHLDIEIISGGGVRDMQDVQRFIDAGCDRVLVATAIHQGSLYSNDDVPPQE